MSSQPPRVAVSALDDPANGFHAPHHSRDALSTSSLGNAAPTY
jgi:hypothetical protein